jgi:alkanesulfonate monooxygenase SsuD/methylene tetrahydromethanopterin reductase-like flavin-dependent oxidoreductase (luciferase family)
MIGPGVEFAKIRKQLDVYRAAVSAAGGSLAREYPIFREVLVGATEAEARADAARYLRTKYDAYFSWGYVETTFENVIRDAFIVGDPHACIRAIERYRDELGITTLLARVQWPGVSHDVAQRGIRLLGEHVLPAVRRKG